MIDETSMGFTETYSKTSSELYNNAYINELNDMAGVMKAVVDFAEDSNFDKDDMKYLFEHYLSEIYG